MERKRNIQIAEPFMDEEEWKALKEPIDTGWVSQGPKVAEFERAFAARHGVKYGVAVSNCTSALHLALLALDITPEDAVIVPSFSWVATANAVEYCGARPLFADIDPISYNIDPNSVEEVLKRAIKNGIKVKAIIAVHLFGLCAEMDAIMAIARNYGLKVIEDAACAAGAMYSKKPAGSIGDIGCFSFHPRKIIVTGEGGMCTTNQKEIAKKIRALRNHGAVPSIQQKENPGLPFFMPSFPMLGYNYRMTDLQGAIGIVQLSRLDGFIRERARWADYYTQQLAGINWIKTPETDTKCMHAWQSYICQLRDDIIPRDDLLELLFQNGISSRVGTQAIHMLDYYRVKYNISPEKFPVSCAAYKNSFALPLHNKLTSDDYQYVVKCLMKII